MAALADPDRLAAYRDALANWNFGGYIDFQLTDQAHRWLRQEFDKLPIKEIGRLMHEYVADGGEIDEVREVRPEWRDDFEFHFDLRFAIQGTPVYVETRLNYRLPIAADESTIVVVNIHAP